MTFQVSLHSGPPACTHSVVADPLFVDPNSDDFRLKPDSPALKLGFHRIDQSKIGPRERP